MNDEHLDDVQNMARGLNRAREDVGESVGELRESLTELDRRPKVVYLAPDPAEPRAVLEVTEDELRYLIETVGETPVDDYRAEGHTVYEKLRQLLKIETGAGGKFCDPS